MINIPARLKEKLEKNDEWIVNVNRVVLNVKDLYVTTPYFFPEYTNHGVVHINNILNIVNELIPDVSLEYMSEKEVAVCIISLILHDIGMFVSFDGFVQLLDEEQAYVDLEGEKTLEQSWREYLLNLKYLSEKDMMNKFGTTDIQVTFTKNETELDVKTRLVIGEFLRQNHHNIAHRIIINGIDNVDFLEGTSIDDQTRDLIGLIARSHGIDIRNTEKYLMNKYTYISKPKNISIFYIMVLVRMADYLDVGEERAAHIISALFVKKSNISKREFLWNQCIKYEDFVWDNRRECITIDAAPVNANQFIDIRKWATGVQYELDMCWAIIGEHYDASNCKLTIRRINANILKKEVVEEYEKKFHTQEATLDANADILKLLIAPLYGDNPSYGVRELLQNAVDACRERESKEKKKETNYEGKVTISLDRKNKQIVLVDNGIGMKIEVIKKYYLVAGASYRRSDAWSREFAESDGKVRILRNGKFGIGVLATFLLGEKATITTRSMDEEFGWEFTIGLDQDNIDIKRVVADIGTKISIDLTDSIIHKLDTSGDWESCRWYGWYEGDKPEVVYLDDGDEINYHKRKITKEEYELIQEQYSRYLWSYNNYYDYSGRAVCCNGIIIPRRAHMSHEKEYRFAVAVPFLRIEDLEGKIPVNLARSELLAIPCKKELYTECCKYVLAKLLALEFDYSKTRFTCGLNRWDEGKYIVFSKEGYTLCDPAFLENAKIGSINIFSLSSRSGSVQTTISSESPIIFHELARGGVTKQLFENLLSGSFFDLSIKESLIALHIDKKSYMYVQDRMQRQKWSYLDVIEKEEYYTISSIASNLLTKMQYNIKDFPMVAELGIGVNELCENDIMLEVLQEYMGNVRYIPYDMEQREKKFPKAFEELKKYMS